jgi:hypothetical protein
LGQSVAIDSPLSYDGDYRAVSAIIWRIPMRFVQRVLCVASAVLGLTAVSQAAPTIIVGNWNPDSLTADQHIRINVTGIEPNTVNGIYFSVMIDGGGPAYGGFLGPVITAMDFDSGPTIWMPPSTSSGHNGPNLYFDPGGQLANAGFLLDNGFVTADSGLVVTLTIDMTGLGFGVHSLDLFGGVIEETLGGTTFTGENIVTSITNGTITYVPEPNSLILGWFALAGFFVWGRCRRLLALSKFFFPTRSITSTIRPASPRGARPSGP